MSDFDKKVYILGPNEEKNERFIGTYFPLEWKTVPSLIQMSTDKLEPKDAIYTYVILDNNEDWLFHYTGNKTSNVVLVKDF